MVKLDTRITVQKLDESTGDGYGGVQAKYVDLFNDVAEVVQSRGSKIDQAFQSTPMVYWTVKFRYFPTWRSKCGFTELTDKTVADVVTKAPKLRIWLRDQSRALYVNGTMDDLRFIVFTCSETR